MQALSFTAYLQPFSKGGTFGSVRVTEAISPSLVS
jgi:hypothetical protein